MLRQTHTFATLEVSPQTFNEIKRLLKEANYDHAFHDEDNIIDMHGIGLIATKDDPRLKPNKNAKVPAYDYLTEGFDPAKLPK